MVDFGNAFGKAAEGLAMGTLAGMQANRQQDIQSRQLDMQQQQIQNNSDQLQAERQKNFVENALNILKMGDSNSALNFWNQNADSVGYPKLESLNPIGSKNWAVKELGGKAYRLNLNNGTVEPLTVNGEQITAGKQTYNTVGDRQALVDPSTGQVKYSGPLYGQEKPAKPAKPEMTPSRALERISAIQKAKSELGKGDVVSQLLATINPELQAGQKMDEATKQELLNAWDEEERYLRQFIPAQQPSSQAQAAPQNAAPNRTIVRTGKTKDGRKVVQYNDGTIEYAE